MRQCAIRLPCPILARNSVAIQVRAYTFEASSQSTFQPGPKRGYLDYNFVSALGNSKYPVQATLTMSLLDFTSLLKQTTMQTFNFFLD